MKPAHFLCSLASVAAFFAGTGAAHAEACATATAACGEWVSVAGGPQRAWVYRTHPLDTRSERIERALIMVHGQGRNADGYFRSAIASAFLAGALEDTVVVAPRFASNEGRCRDKLAPDELNWICSGPQSWRNGGAAVGKADVTSYHVTDELLGRLSRKEVFPNLRSIVLVGHSAGGQYTTRYAMVNQVHDRLGLRLRYVVANPSSYTYPDALRPTISAVPRNVAALPPGYVVPIPAKPPAPFQKFADANNCTTFDQWPYGMQNRVGYSAQFPAEQLVRQLAGRSATFLLGELDILPLYGFDSSCAAMAQGPTRFARGLAYARYLNDNFGAQHQTVIVRACGHSARCMFTAEAALPILFPKE